MDRELCPRCGVLREVRPSTLKRKVADEEGKPREVLTRTYHCTVCSTFVRAEDVAVEVEEGEDG